MHPALDNWVLDIEHLCDGCFHGGVLFAFRVLCPVTLKIERGAGATFLIGELERNAYYAPHLSAKLAAFCARPTRMAHKIIDILAAAIKVSVRAHRLAR
jgi:hypothetical protein